jgi:hypothetical protein
MQDENAGEDVEESQQPAISNSEIQKFVKQARWTRIKSKFEIEIEVVDWPATPPYRTVEKGVEMKHCKRKQRFRKWREVMQEEITSSQLIGPEEEEQNPEPLEEEIDEHHVAALARPLSLARESHN